MGVALGEPSLGRKTSPSAINGVYLQLVFARCVRIIAWLAGFPYAGTRKAGGFSADTWRYDGLSPII
jgi:hypothetical protein